MTPCPITADRDAWRGAVTEREAALVEALADAIELIDDHMPGEFPEPVAAFRALLARAHTATDAGGEA